ncbi:MAG: pyruvate:ferredoxin (flavodoxin) oxidoreductase, partial [Planctomycetes bacterium]|nr:pyruvate:ferredoxin (flavodoxin) oxidoreductase [Planctomycetota bacterium]
SNTGGQCSKATPQAAVAKFAAGGKPLPKKDLGMLAMTYGNVYVAQVALGANDSQCVKAFVEAESYDGPSIIIAYCHCIAHGIDMRTALDQQKRAVQSGAWPIYRYDPRRAARGENPLQLDSKAPSISLKDYAYNETRFKMLTTTNPEQAERLLQQAQQNLNARWQMYEHLASMPGAPKEEQSDR